jgi:hypothetical protein
LAIDNIDENIGARGRLSGDMIKPAVPGRDIEI